MKLFSVKDSFVLVLLIIIFIALFYTIEEMPAFGDINSPANNYLAAKYVNETLADTNSPNMVTAIISDYRAFDTLGETTVLFTSICAVITVLKRK
jgi:multisubunit Na+/H+ antiporter MnhB subunit